MAVEQGTANPGQPERTSYGSGAEVLHYWRALLADRTRLQQLGSGGDAQHEARLRELLHTAIRLRQGRPQAALPEEAIDVLRQVYLALDSPGRLQLLRNLTAGFGVQRRDVEAAVAAWQQLAPQQAVLAVADGAAPAAAPAAAADERAAQLGRAADRLANACQPLFSLLFVPISQQPAGIKFLVDLRADLLSFIWEQPGGAGPLRALSEALRRRLAEWFSVGLLQLERLTWEGSSAALLEKVVAGEAVHAYSGWEDLRRRLDPATRRAFAFFHPAMPGEPLVVLHTALVDHVAESIAEILAMAEADAAHRGTVAEAAPCAAAAGGAQGGAASSGGGAVGPGSGAPTTAVFYSISAYQKGLQGVDLGNFLIKQVAHRLLAEFGPTLRMLATLSPLPGFASWLRMEVSLQEQDTRRAAALEPLLRPAEAAALAAAARGAAGAAPLPPAGAGAAGEKGHAAALLRWALQGDRWVGDRSLEAAVRPALLRLAARYLLRERRRGLALDPVANFHLRNGATVLALRWRADLSSAGLARSHGLMVNYSYQLDAVVENNRRYLVDQQVLASPEVLEELEELPVETSAVVGTHRCCAERRLLQSYVRQGQKQGVRPHALVAWVRRKLGSSLVIWRRTADGAIGCAAPCLFCARELRTYDLRVHCPLAPAPGGGGGGGGAGVRWFSGRLSDAGAPTPRLTGGQQKVLRKQGWKLCDAPAPPAERARPPGGRRRARAQQQR
eukprot:scaffold2.g7327.t1